MHHGVPGGLRRVAQQDTQDTHISGMAERYASALFSLAKEQNAVDSVGSALADFSALIQASPDLQRLVRSPAFSAEDQTRALDAVLNKIGITGLTASFIKLVATKRRLFAIGDMINGYRRLSDAAKGVTRATVTVAEPLSDAQTSALQDALRAITGGKSVEVDVQHDPGIIGGLIVRIGSRMVDGSLKTKLNSIRTRMKEVG